MSSALAIPFVGPNAGSVAGINFNVENVNPPGGPVYGPGGDLENVAALPGAGAYGSLGNPITVVSNPGGGIAAPAAPLGSFGAPQLPVPAVGFGDTNGGSANLEAKTFLGGAGAGIFWNSQTFIWDSGPNNRASTNFSRGIANFSDPSGDTVRAIVALGVFGTTGGQGPAGAFVAASLLGNFSIFDGNGALTDRFSMSVAIVSDGPGQRADIVTNTSSRAGDVFNSGFFFPGADSFTAFGIDFLDGIFIPFNGRVTLDGTLSLVADPDVMVELFPGACQLPPSSSPQIGFIGCSVPEPSSVAVLGTGLLLLLGLALGLRQVSRTLN